MMLLTGMSLEIQIPGNTAWKKITVGQGIYSS
jgi:hypothetical protein